MHLGRARAQFLGREHGGAAIGKRRFGKRFLGTFQQVLDREIEPIGRFHLTLYILVVAPEKIEGIVPTTAGMVHIALQHGKGRGLISCTAIFHAPFKRRHTGK